ncbi:uncharacterized protein LOC126894958 isoform X2 [Daktulosphaira vitifoliae]|uniref:uncharacterized protein LOC126894958 isoform X2 n=1 Tax=Daktulosphaira vitifoliae TaxID=58002 RepID=UPI0021A9F0F5|nr:uncharacterized protein LOC126894958 isoform X2 [Daktulosphaira vitifoliae]
MFPFKFIPMMMLMLTVESFVFDSCERTNLTKQECVGKVILETLNEASEHPENLFKFNDLENESGMIRFVKLKFDNSSAYISQKFDIDESRSSKNVGFWSQLVSVIGKMGNYSGDHGILVPLPRWSKDFPQISLVNEDDVLQVVNESRGGKHKKLALLFPLLATFKFIFIKALLVPILIAVMIIKKIMVLGIMLLPAALAMLRFCRNGQGLGNLVTNAMAAPAAAFAPLQAADMSGDYSNYVQQAAAASHHQGGYKDYSKNLFDAMKGVY